MTPYMIHVAFDVALYALYAPFLLALGNLLFQTPFRARALPIVFAISACARALTLLLFQMTAVGYLIQVVGYAWVCAFGLRLRGWRLFSGFFVVMACLVLVDLMVMRVMVHFYDFEALFASGADAPLPVLKPAVFPALTLATVICQAAILLALWLGRGAIRLLRQKGVRRKVRVARPFAIGAALLMGSIGLIMDADQIFVQLDPGQLPHALREYAFSLLGIVLLAMYVTQDFRALRLSRRNETLERQQHIYDDLLRDVRAFRHNIANLLYGLEGKILSGDLDDIQRYYEGMAKALARVNNENAVALGRMDNQSVRALLLNKLHRALSLGIPVNLQVEGPCRWHYMGDGDLCQLLGILIDNALEAAQSSDAPQVSIAFAQNAGATDILIRNTFDLQRTNLRFLQGTPATSKPGHDGLGLTCAAAIVSAHPTLAMSQMRRGRYIETLLQLGRP